MEGTLRKGLGLLAALPPGISRALYMMFVVPATMSQKRISSNFSWLVARRPMRSFPERALDPVLPDRQMEYTVNIVIGL